MNNQSLLSVQNRSSAGAEKASSKSDVLPKFRLGTAEESTIWIWMLQGRRSNEIVVAFLIKVGIIIPDQQTLTENCIERLAVGQNPKVPFRVEAFNLMR